MNERPHWIIATLLCVLVGFALDQEDPEGLIANALDVLCTLFLMLLGLYCTAHAIANGDREPRMSLRIRRKPGDTPGDD